MAVPRICLTLTGSTLKEDAETAARYRPLIDMVELRADYLTEDEQLYIRRFPSMVDVPCVLTIRRKTDGGRYDKGETARAVLFAKALAFADADKRNNFAFVDFEEDFRVSSLEDATLAFETRIIRSLHKMNAAEVNLVEKLASLRFSGYEIPKIAFMPRTLDDVTRVFETAKTLGGRDRILLAMGPLGAATRILGAKLNNFLTYTSAPETLRNTSDIAHIDVETLSKLYRIRSIDDETKIFGITGWPLSGTSSPEIHNTAYAKRGINAVYIPFPAEDFNSAMKFAEAVGLGGFSVTVPHKESALTRADFLDDTASGIGAVNTMVKMGSRWHAYNTDADGLRRSLLEFLDVKSLRRMKVSIIGAGGAAKSAAYAVNRAGGAACVFNRTLPRAKALASRYGFRYAPLGSESIPLIQKYSDIIIQATSKGMHEKGKSSPKNDPLYFYDFTGKEILFDVIYMPAVTPVMARAEQAGCRVSNGYNMLLYQAYKQFELFTGVKYL